MSPSDIAQWVLLFIGIGACIYFEYCRRKELAVVEAIERDARARLEIARLKFEAEVDSVTKAEIALLEAQARPEATAENMAELTRATKEPWPPKE